MFSLLLILHYPFCCGCFCCEKRENDVVSVASKVGLENPEVTKSPFSLFGHKITAYRCCVTLKSYGLYSYHTLGRISVFLYVRRV